MVLSFLPKNVHFIWKNEISCLLLFCPSHIKNYIITGLVSNFFMHLVTGWHLLCRKEITISACLFSGNQTKHCRQYFSGHVFPISFLSLVWFQVYGACLSFIFPSHHTKKSSLMLLIFFLFKFINFPSYFFFYKILNINQNYWNIQIVVVVIAVACIKQIQNH